MRMAATLIETGATGKRYGTSCYLRVLLAAIVVLSPSVPLLYLNGVFAVNWTNHTWLINYFAEYLKSHGHFPAVINTFEYAGMAYPVFYGYLFFPLFGFLSLFTDGAFTVRIAAILTWAMEFYLFYRLIAMQSGSRALGFLTGTLVIWAIYPMTNLYNRSAVTEFFATAFLFCAIALWFEALFARQESRRILLGNLTVFLLVLAAGSHPITAVYGAVCLAAVMTISLVLKGPRDVGSVVRHMVVPAIIGILCLLPWLYATHKFVRHIKVSDFSRVAYYPGSLDSSFARLTPFPLPSGEYDRMLKAEHVGTRNLDTQISIPLFLLFGTITVWLLRNRELGKNRLTAVLVLLVVSGAVLTYFSLVRGSMDRLGYLARSIQFAYRLVTYINLTFLIGIVTGLSFRKNRSTPVRISYPVMAAIFTMASAGLIIKISRSCAIITPLPQAPILRSEPHTLLHLPPTFYGFYAYTTPGSLPYVKSEDAACAPLVFRPGTDSADFANPVAAPVPRHSRWLITNLQEFDWNIIKADGKPIATTDLGTHDLKLCVGPGDSGVLTCEFTPDRIWSKLNACAIPLFFLWALSTGSLTFLSLAARQKNQSSARIDNGLAEPPAS